MTTYHVVPDGKTWTVKTNFGNIVSQGHRKKARAVDEMNNAATRGDVKLIHGQQGQIQERSVDQG